jgi:rubrerythrin
MNSDALLRFLAYSTELEQESKERYTELSESMEAHHNVEVAAFFHRMAEEADNHLAEVTLLSSGSDLPSIQAWEFDWPGAEPPETTSYEAVHYRMTLREAMLLALENERAAESFYREYSQRDADTQVRTIAAEFAEEEAGHAHALELMLQNVPQVSEHSREEDDPPGMPE